MSISRRLSFYYVLTGAIAAGILVLGFSLGAARHSEPNVAGVWTTTPRPDACLGPTFVVQQSGAFVQIVPMAGTGPHATLRVRSGRLSGTVGCIDGTHLALAATVEASPRRLALQLAGRPGVIATDTGKSVPQAGTKVLPPTSLAGTYKTVPASACLGPSVTLAERGGGRIYAVVGASGATAGTLTFDDATGSVGGGIQCRAAASSTVTLVGSALDRTVTLGIPGPGGIVANQFQLQRTRDSESLFAAFFLAVAVVMIAAQLGGMLMPLIGQPRVMGEVIAGILLGPTLLGATAPRLESALFPSDVVPYIAVAANLGLIFYMFLIGMELDLGALRGRVSQTLAISNTGVVVPMALGVLAAVPVYPLLGSQKAFVPFALFMGVSMSITAFPVLARILVERRMLARPLGALALASAAIDDVTAWVLIALATATVGGAESNGVAETIGLTAAFALVMAFAVRPLLARVSVAFGETGRLPTGWVAVIFAGVLVSAYITAEIGVAIIFGAFVMGAIMPRHAGLTEDVTRRIESFVAAVLLPLFFASTGLRTNMLLIDRPELVLITIGLTALAIVAKFGGTLLAARVTGLGWRDASVLGSLMNTRGLTELIVLNLALDMGVLTEALFAALVVMALVTTFMTGPMLRLLDPANSLGEDASEALDAVLPAAGDVAPARRTERKILVAPETAEGLPALLAIAEPLARSEPPRELVLLRLLTPTAGAEIRGGLQSEQRRLRDATRELQTLKGDLASRGVAARGAALTSSNPGQDLVKVADREQVDLVILDGRRPIIGSAISSGSSKTVLETAAPDVVVVVASERHVLPPPTGAPVVVPFGGSAHDWAALELGAWLSAALGSPMRLLGSAGESGGDSASRLLANASLMLQRFIGVESEPVIVEPGDQGVLDAARGAAFLVVGLSDRWQEEGLGETRAQLARSADAPILFVRRGSRAGVLAGREDVTRFKWSSPGGAS